MCMERRRLPGPVRIALGILAWALVLWVLTLGHSSFVPVAKFIFIVLVVPMAVVEWIKMKGLLKETQLPAARVLMFMAAGLIWYLNK